MHEDLCEFIIQLPEPRQSQVRKLFEEIWPRFSISPASTKYHGNYIGGLLDHTLLVTKGCLDLFDLYKIQDLIREELLFCALVHDIGKIGTLDEPMYIMIDSKFEYNKKIKMDHELLTLFWLNQYGIKVTEKEFAAIYYHAGPYVEAYKKTHETSLLMLLHTADNLAAKIQGI